MSNLCNIIFAAAVIVEPPQQASPAPAPGGAPGVIAASWVESLPGPDGLLEWLRSGGVGSLRKLWADLGITSDLFGGLADSTSLDIQQIPIDHGDTEAVEILFRITDSAASDFQYLALSHSAEQWTNLGIVEFRNQRSAAPEHAIEALDSERRWLVIRALKGSGNGFERRHESWYALESGLPLALTYPVAGHVNGHGMPFNRTFTGARRGVRDHEGAATVDVDLSVQYTNGEQFAIEGLTELFTRSAALQYVFSVVEARFTLDESNSGMNEAEIDGIFADDVEGFLRHNFTQLKELAQSGDPLKREWLERFLDGREESSEKAILEDLLQVETDIGVQAAADSSSTESGGS